jgi:hypothetical protein
LVVAGYSGRDDSILDVLTEVLSHDRPFPAGLFWLHRGEDSPLPRVTDLLRLAAEKRVDGGLVRIENFDETLRDLVRLMTGLDSRALDAFAAARQRWTAPARANGNRGFPVVRLNGLPVELVPTVCRRVVCKIGGYAEVLAAVEAAGVDVLIGRTRSGVLAFGSDVDVRAAFEPFEIAEFDLHAIEARRLRYDSGERGLLREAMSRALARENHLHVTRRRNADLLTPIKPDDAGWEPLKKLVGRLSGAVDGHPELLWREGIGTRLEWADDRLWLVFEPRTTFEGVTDDNRAASTDFGRERTVRRYNRQLNDLIAFWARKLAKGGADLRALDVGSGVDAVFRLSVDTAYSRRVRA